MHLHTISSVIETETLRQAILPGGLWEVLFRGFVFNQRVSQSITVCSRMHLENI